jgi:hypothetical protein
VSNKFTGYAIRVVGEYLMGSSLCVGPRAINPARSTVASLDCRGLSNVRFVYASLFFSRTNVATRTSSSSGRISGNGPRGVILKGLIPWWLFV